MLLFKPCQKLFLIFFNHKKYFSIVLLAMVDAECKLLVVDVGAYGQNSDVGVFNDSIMATAVKNNTCYAWILPIEKM